MGSRLSRRVKHSKGARGAEPESGIVTSEMGVRDPRGTSLFQHSRETVDAEDTFEMSFGGVLEPRCSWMALTSADTSGRRLENPEGPAVEKNRLGGALGASWDAFWGAGTRRGVGGANASSGTRVACRAVLLKLPPL